MKGDRHVTNTCSNTACFTMHWKSHWKIRTKLQRTKLKLALPTSFSHVCHSSPKVSSWVSCVSWVSSFLIFWHRHVFARSHPNWGHDWLIPPWSFMSFRRVNRVKSQRKQTIRDFLLEKLCFVLRTRLCPPLRGGPQIKARTKKKVENASNA